MPRGGARPGAGRKPNPDSVRSKAKAAREAKSLAVQMTTDGIKKPEAPESWPFGVQPAPMSQEPKPPEPKLDLEKDLDALTYLQRIYRDPTEDPKARFQAAIQAVPYEVAKPGVTGKKAAKDEAAKKAHSRFAPSSPPKLAAVAGKKV